MVPRAKAAGWLFDMKTFFRIIIFYLAASVTSRDVVHTLHTLAIT